MKGYSFIKNVQMKIGNITVLNMYTRGYTVFCCSRDFHFSLSIHIGSLIKNVKYPTNINAGLSVSRHSLFSEHYKIFILKSYN